MMTLPLKISLQSLEKSASAEKLRIMVGATGPVNLIAMALGGS